MNCLGRLSRDSGHMREPDPPHMITGRILVILSPHWRSESPCLVRFLCIGNRSIAAADGVSAVIPDVALDDRAAVDNRLASGLCRRLESAHALAGPPYFVRAQAATTTASK